MSTSTHILEPVYVRMVVQKHKKKETGPTGLERRTDVHLSSRP